MAPQSNQSSSQAEQRRREELSPGGVLSFVSQFKRWLIERKTAYFSQPGTGRERSSTKRPAEYSAGRFSLSKNSCFQEMKTGIL
ncbi:hypothetical protein [Pseudoflavonifractor capillosus]|uniref:hypothetical protein n=1 Tax=Pseudoflavonifractor capillosus TaxID=106588 RepID=UPI00195C2963|nr:hypothetical protein [Pseudoflavonifractor capillosus]MBM6680758.1 hypothetical protein [Pseudoflavonifractor capillosus]